MNQEVLQRLKRMNGNKRGNTKDKFDMLTKASLKSLSFVAG